MAGIFGLWVSGEPAPPDRISCEEVHKTMARKVSKEQTATLLERMRGVIVANATPLNEDGSLDVAGTERLVERVIDGGASCLFILGWCGEGPLLRDKTRLAVMKETVRMARGRVPIMVGVSEQSLPRTLDLVAMAKEAKADLILATPPYSYTITQSEVYEYFKALATESGMPLIIYQNDEVGVKVEPSTLKRLSDIPGVIGVKVYMPYNSLQKTFMESDKPGQFVVINGDEYLYAPSLLLGIRHFTMGGPGNLCPGWCSDMIQAADKGDWASVIAKHKRMTAFCNDLYSLSSNAYTMVKGGMEQLGICDARISSPHPALTAAQKKGITKVLAEYADVVAR